jgi:prolyl-tRNA synthetase
MVEQTRNKIGGGKADQLRITPRAEDYSRWYLEIVSGAQLADHSAVRGCMVIRPNGYAIWEKMKSELDVRFRATGHRNAYFPLFIPMSFFSREAEHVEGFAKECAVVTHHRLRAAAAGGVEVDADARLQEPLVVRPTSETIIWSAYKEWIQSYRDLPLLINQWANVVRWEMRTRQFLRTAEFLWQEGHTAHASEQEAREEAERMLEVYRDFAENVMAMPVLRGRKTAGERFAGAVETYAIEAMMQDKKSLQAGTSHYLGETFAKAFDVKFQDEKGELRYVQATSWGVSTRLIGALIMAHSDDTGLILPPKLAEPQVVVVPIYKSDADRYRVLAEGAKVKAELCAQGLLATLDDRDGVSPGFKYFDWELKGVPLRIEVGPRDLDQGQLCLVRRFVLESSGEDEKTAKAKRKCFLPRAEALARVRPLLDEMQSDLFNKAAAFRLANSRVVSTLDELEQYFKKEGGGFAWVFWDGSGEDEKKMSEKFKTSIRCLPFPGQAPLGINEEGKCIWTGRTTKQLAVMAEAY